MIKTLLLGIGAIGLGLTLALLLIFTYIGIRGDYFRIADEKGYALSQYTRGQAEARRSFGRSKPRNWPAEVGTFLRSR